MTEYEMLDLVGTFQGMANAAIMSYLTIFSAYCIVAYMVGSQLTRSQAIVTTVLFLIMALFMTWGTWTYFRGSRLLMEQVVGIAGGVMSPVKPHQVITPLLLIGILAGLKFMWDVRHPKKE